MQNLLTGLAIGLLYVVVYDSLRVRRLLIVAHEKLVLIYVQMGKLSLLIRIQVSD